METSIISNYENILPKDYEVDQLVNINIKIYDFFLNRNIPIFINDINFIKNFAKQLYPFYLISEDKSKNKYELNIKKNLCDGSNKIPIYILDMTIYCNQRILLHLKFGKIEYTQLQIGKFIIQSSKFLNKKKDSNLIFDSELNKYAMINKVNFKDSFSNILKETIKNIFNENNYFFLDNDKKINTIITLFPSNNSFKIETMENYKLTIEISKFNNDIKKYLINVELKKGILNFELLSKSESSYVLYSLLNNKQFYKFFKKEFNNEKLNFSQYFDISLDYLKIEYNQNYNFYHISRKQIFYNDNMIFDGSCSCERNSQMLIEKKGSDSDLKINEFLPYNSSKNNSTIHLNVLNHVIGDLIFKLPDFMINNEYLTKQYIFKNFNNFSVNEIIKIGEFKYSFTTYNYDNNNFLSSKIINYYELNNLKNYISDITQNQIIYNINGNIISEYNNTIKKNNNNEDILTKSNIFIEFENYKIAYSKFISNTNKQYIKNIFKNNKLIFNGFINNGDLNFENYMDKNDKIKFQFNDHLINNFISKFGFDLNKLNEKKIKKELFTKITEEEIITEDKLFNYKFTYNYWNEFINKYGNIISNIKNIIVSKNENNNEEKMVEIDQHNYDKDGQQINSKFIDNSNRLVIKALTQKEINDGRIGYKAGRTIDNKMCIIKLFIPKDSKVAWDQYKDKYRTNKVVVLKITPIYYSKQKYFYNKDFEIEECPICLDFMVSHIAYPCRHKLCGICWETLLKISCNKNCPYCKSIIENVEELPKNKPSIDNNTEIIEAYSCVHTNDFKYSKNEEIIINDFDTDLKKVCSNGIHFESSEKDVFKWFEYLNIPSEILQNEIPWIYEQEKKEIEEIKNVDSVDELMMLKGRNDILGFKKKNEKILINEDDLIEFSD